jgi:hypothetical protein
MGKESSTYGVLFCSIFRLGIEQKVVIATQQNVAPRETYTIVYYYVNVNKSETVLVFDMNIARSSTIIFL